MNLNPNDAYKKLVDAGDAWAEAMYSAELMEEGKKPLLAKLAAECEASSMAAKESWALAHPLYKEHIEAMVGFRREACKAKVRWESAKIWAELLRTKNANDRFTSGRAV